MSLTAKLKSHPNMDTGKLFILFLLVALGSCALTESKTQNMINSYSTAEQTNHPYLNKHIEINGKSENDKRQSDDFQEFGKVFLEYAKDVINRETINIVPGVYIQRKAENKDEKSQAKSVGGSIVESLKKFTETHMLRVDLARASTATGRLFFFKGLKKLMWPLFIGLQVVKTVLLVLFLPSIIGSVGKIVGKGLPSLSGSFAQFSQPGAQVESVDDLDFKDNSLNSDNDDATFNSAYQYNIPDSKNNNFAHMYEAAQANNALSRLGLDKVSLVESHNRNSGQLSKRNDFKVFHDIPQSSLLLSNYDPFYSPLLSRLDAVFQQLGLASNNDEKCREKLVCLMYSNPAKYAPYSNLVSAQLSRELNELKKPTSDNPEILRFFKYMRAAKDGQDGIDCELSYKQCTTFNDMNGPAMINTFNDINKLVQARRM